MTKIMTVLMMAFFLIMGNASAEEKGGKAGDGFRKAAVGYEKKAATAVKNGHAEISKCYRRMAAIKRSAAKLADQGKWDDISWKEYHELEAKINKLRGHKKGHKK